MNHFGHKMSLIDNIDRSTEDLYQKYMAFNNIMLEDYKPLEIAAVMTIQGLSFYRSFLSEEDYQKMIQSIYDQRDKVQSF